MNEKTEAFDVIILLRHDELEKLRYVLPYLKQNINADMYRVITDDITCVSGYAEPTVDFIDENIFLRRGDVQNIISDITDGDQKSYARAGWYLQQFVKLSYARVCKKKFYMLWDGDTIPLKPVEMFFAGKPVFHMKTEYHQSYFTVMQKLVNGLGKLEKRSYIAEHMLMNTEIVQELLDEIESNNKIEGLSFYEKILHSIEKSEIQASGFSEFETYGNFCEFRHSDVYLKKDWKSLRNAGEYFSLSQLSQADVKWLSTEYDAASFEKNSILTPLHDLYSSGEIQGKYTFCGFCELIMQHDQLQKNIYIAAVFRRYFEKWKNKKLILYGTGIIADAIVRYNPDFQFAGILDQKQDKERFHNYSVLNWEQAEMMEIEIIVIAASQIGIQAVSKRIGNRCREDGIRLYDCYGINRLDPDVINSGEEKNSD